MTVAEVCRAVANYVGALKQAWQHSSRQDLDTQLGKTEEHLEVWEGRPGPLFACPHCGETMCCRLAAQELQTDHPK